jgi:predicted amino acid dehydrogenase
LDNFAFILHPVDPKRDVARKYPLLGRHLSAGQIDYFSHFFPPVFLSQIQGVRSAASGNDLIGWFVACPLTPARMLELPVEAVYRKIIQTGRLAERLGARLLGLGAFTSVIGDAGETIARSLSIPVTTGDSYTVAVAIQSIREAARQMDIRLPEATAAVVGAAGAIGRVSAQLLAREVRRLLLIGQRRAALEEVRERCLEQNPAADVGVTSDLTGLAQADVVLAVSSAVEALIEPAHLKPGVVVCDVARPRDVAASVAAARDDVLVIDGGMVCVPSGPGGVRFNFDFGFPPGMAYACMAETMALALEGCYESFTLGRRISLEQVETIAALAARHGFNLSGFRSFDRPVTREQIDRVREQARRKTGHS